MKLISKIIPQSRINLVFYTLIVILNEQYGKFYKQYHLSATNLAVRVVEAHVVIEKNDYGQNLVLNGRGGGGDQLIISGNAGGAPGHSSNLIMQDAANRDGDVVINGRNIIVPGENGHIVLADSRSNEQSQSQMPNYLGLWIPYLYGSDAWRMLPYMRNFNM